MMSGARKSQYGYILEPQPSKHLLRYCMKTQKPEPGNPDGNFKILFDKKPKNCNPEPKNPTFVTRLHH